MTSVAKTYDDLAAEYDSRYVGPRWRLYDEVTLRTAETYLPAGSRVLDAGAGNGKFASMLLERGHHVTLLEPSTSMLREARVRLRGSARSRFAGGSVDSLPFRDGAFDFVFCEGDPLSYCIATHREAAGEILRVLRPGGGFYISCDNRWSAGFALLAQGHVEAGLRAIELGIAADPYGMRVHAFEPAELDGVMRAAGAVDVRVTGKLGLAQFLAQGLLGEIEADPAARARLLDAEMRIATDPAMAGLSGHLQVVGRAPEAAQ